MMIREAIAKVVTGTDLDELEMVSAMNEIMSGECTPAQIGAFITALRIKGETVAEIAGAAQVMRQKATRVEVFSDDRLLADIVGTGGDSSGTFNVSTTTAFVVAAAGVPVAKHGNRSVSSHCGSADVLEALGVNLSLSPALIAQCVREVGIGFMFAPMLHGAMKHAIGPRREIGIRTIFNVLGPLTNPAGANVYLLGVYSPDLTEKLARVLGKFGVRRALVVCAEGNIDEITVTGETLVADYADGRVRTYTITPEQFGFQRALLADIKGAETPEASAAQLREILGGAAGACLDTVLFNAGAALFAAGKTDDLAAGIGLARGIVASGNALQKVDQLVAFCKYNA